MTVDILPDLTRSPGRDAFQEGMACALLLGAIRSFDWPCACGHRSDECTKRKDGTCDG